MTVWHNAKRPKSHLIEALRPFLSAFILSVLFDKVNGKFAHFPTIRRNPRFALSNYELYGRMSSRTLLQALTVEFPLERGRTSFIVPDASAKGVRLMYVTYSDLFQFGLLICAIIGLCLTYRKK